MVNLNNLQLDCILYKHRLESEFQYRTLTYNAEQLTCPKKAYLGKYKNGQVISNVDNYNIILHDMIVHYWYI